MGTVNPNYATDVAAQKNFGHNFSVTQSSMPRLAPGLRSQSAKNDDAALTKAIANRLQSAQQKENTRSVNNAVNSLQEGEKAAADIKNNLNRMKELAQKATDKTLTDDQKAAMQDEFNKLSRDNAKIAQATKHDGKGLFQNGQTVSATTGDGKSIEFKSQGLDQVSGDLFKDPQKAAADADRAITQVSKVQNNIGKTLNRLENAQEKQAAQDTLRAAQAEIQDMGFANKITAQAAKQLLSGTAMSVLSQVNSLSQIAMNLLRG